MAFLSCIFRCRPLECTLSRSLCSKQRRHFFGLFFLILAFAALGPDRAQAQSKEYQLKAAFLFNFAQFVKWPAASFGSADAPFNIGILGDDPFGAALEETVQGEAIDNHKLRVVHGRTLDDLKDCELIFISKSEEDHLGEIIGQLDSKPILTVSDIDSFALSGGAIDFYLQDGRVRFEINPDSAQRKGLKISSQLLNLGRIVKGGN
jgi:YfiR/HmsC-like